MTPREIALTAALAGDQHGSGEAAGNCVMTKSALSKLSNARLQRWTKETFGTKTAQMTTTADGEWVRYRDVRKLERKNARLREAGSKERRAFIAAGMAYWRYRGRLVLCCSDPTCKECNFYRAGRRFARALQRRKK